MIIDLEKFIEAEKPYWDQLEKRLNILEAEPATSLSLEEIKNFQYLYERAAGALGKVTTFASEPELRRYLETLVARAYGEIHESERRPNRFRPVTWFVKDFPRVFRKYIQVFFLACSLFLAGGAFGGLALIFDPSSKPILMPFSHLLGDPARRVAQEESLSEDARERSHATFSGALIANNTQVSLNALALGVTYGVGTIILLFYNGIILGAVVVDYLNAGQGPFLVGWILPHGSVEIPSILIAGTAGLILAGGMIGKFGKGRFSERLKSLASDILLLIFGVAILLVWAGIVESFFSQFHAPVLPYPVKISFGVLQTIGLALFLMLSGREKEKENHGQE